MKPNKILEMCTQFPAGVKWFTLLDCCWRYALVFITIYWALITTPLSFALYTFKWSQIWCQGFPAPGPF